MKKPAFLEGVGVALIASISGAVGYFAFSLLFPPVLSLQLVIMLGSLSYILYLLSRSQTRTGRVSVLSFWTLATLLIWLFTPDLINFTLLQVALLWLVRSLYFHNGPLAAIADLGLNGLALIAAIWAILQTGSLFLAIWCFFLVQALFVAIPHIRPQGQTSPAADDNRFDKARHAAEQALGKLSSSH